MKSLNINRRKKQLIKGQLEEMDGAPKKKEESLVLWSPEEVYGEGWVINPVGEVPILKHKDQSSGARHPHRSLALCICGTASLRSKGRNKKIPRPH